MKKRAFVLLGVVLAMCAIAEAHPVKEGFVNGFGLSMVVDGTSFKSGEDSVVAVDSNYTLKLRNRNQGIAAHVRIVLDGVTVIDGLSMDSAGRPQERTLEIDRQIVGPTGFGNLYEHVKDGVSTIRAEFTYILQGKAHVDVVTIKVGR